MCAAKNVSLKIFVVVIPPTRKFFFGMAAIILRHVFAARNSYEIKVVEVKFENIGFFHQCCFFSRSAPVLHDMSLQ